MLDFSHLPTSTNCDVQVFGPATTADGVQWQTWQKPRGCSMIAILVVGPGGNGGSGVVGAVSLAGGGGGGGCGGQSFLCVPATRLPDTLYCQVPNSEAAIPARVYIYPTIVANHSLVFANMGVAGGNGTTAPAGGTAGTGAAVATVANMPLSGFGLVNLISGQNGIVGGAAIAGAALTIPVNGLVVTGGTGGGGLGATAVAGKDGGSFTVTGAFPPQSGGLGGATATTPGGNGSNGYDGVVPGLRYSYGGTGGGSSHGSATGAGLFGGNGGNGGIGCGGGGGGGCLTGGVAGVGGRGGPGQIIIISW